MPGRQPEFDDSGRLIARLPPASRQSFFGREFFFEQLLGALTALGGVFPRPQGYRDLPYRKARVVTVDGVVWNENPGRFRPLLCGVWRPRTALYGPQ